jgi:hypothetical protein
LHGKVVAQCRGRSHESRISAGARATEDGDAAE